MLVMYFIVHFFGALFVCLRIPFVCLLNDFTEVYSYLWMAVYMVWTVRNAIKYCMSVKRRGARVNESKNTLQT